MGDRIDRLTRPYKFILIFYRPVGAGSPRYLTPIDKLYKPAPTPPTNDANWPDNSQLKLKEIGTIALQKRKAIAYIILASFTVRWGRVYQDYLWVTELIA
ncbi:MAG: hypothetical protein ACBR50_18775 [Microcoleus sp.]